MDTAGGCPVRLTWTLNDLYEVTAAKVWSYGHQGAEFPRDYAWPERSRVLAPPLVSSGWHDATNTVG